MAAGHQPLTISANSKERWREGIRSSFDNPVDSFTSDAELFVIESYDQIILKMEQRIEKHARNFKQQDYRLLRTASGIGNGNGSMFFRRPSFRWIRAAEKPVGITGAIQCCSRR